MQSQLFGSWPADRRGGLGLGAALFGGGQLGLAGGARRRGVPGGQRVRPAAARPRRGRPASLRGRGGAAPPARSGRSPGRPGPGHPAVSSSSAAVSASAWASRSSSWPLRLATSVRAACAFRPSSCSTASKRWVPKRLCSSSRRSVALERRKAAKSPCGSITTRVNCSRFMPRTSAISAPASSLRPDFSIHSPSTRSRSRVLACCTVKPFLPRALGLSQAGERETSKCRPRAENSHVTRGLGARPRRGRCAAACRPAGRRAPNRKARSRWHPGHWFCRRPWGR